MISLFLSGAADKIKFHIGVLTAFWDRGIVPKEIFGTSSGSIAGLFYVCGRLKEAKEFNFSAKSIFTFDPFSFWGYLIGVINIFSGKGYIWKYYGLRDTIKQFISEKDFQDYKRSTMPKLYVGLVDTERNTEEIRNIKECHTLDDALDIIIASSTIYGFNDVVTIDGNKYVDGGAKSHIPTELGLKQMTTNTAVTVYSRPQEYSKIELPKKFIKRLSFWFEQILFNISKNDELITDLVAGQNNIEIVKIFTPYKLLKGFFNVTPEENELFFEYGYKEGTKIWTNLTKL